MIAAAKTIAALRALDTPADADDRRDRKAADYLQGLLLLAQGDSAGAATALQAAGRAKGYEYDVYALALARALAAQGESRQAR